MRGRWLTPDAPSGGYICRLLRIPNSVEFEAIVNGALDDLQMAWNFEQSGDLTPQETADLFAQMFDDYRTNRGCMLGTIFAYATTTAPTGSLPCDGSSHLRTDYPDLYAALDSAYHIDADHFSTPDLRGRSVVGVGQGSGLTNRTIDQSGGEETHTLVTGEIPSHAHQYSVNYVPVLVTIGAVPAGGVPGVAATNTTNTGGGGAHQNMHPWRALRYAIWAV